MAHGPVVTNVHFNVVIFSWPGTVIISYIYIRLFQRAICKSAIKTLIYSESHICIEMQTERIERYRAKINYIVQNLENLPEDHTTKILIDALYYEVFTAIEAVMDLIAMFLKDNGYIVTDDYANIDLLIINQEISAEIGNGLKECNGLRNILVHRYNGIDQQRVEDVLENVKSVLYQWIEIVEGMLNGASADQEGS